MNGDLDVAYHSPIVLERFFLVMRRGCLNSSSEVNHSSLLIFFICLLPKLTGVMMSMPVGLPLSFRDFGQLVGFVFLAASTVLKHGEYNHMPRNHILFRLLLLIRASCLATFLDQSVVLLRLEPHR
jgi:hypothetical protein